ncbi:MAG: response regulator transcription factor, partial [Rikenellaceae bacterium]
MDNYRILVVDDEESICEILQLNLQAEGYTVDVAYSAEEALKLDIKSYSLLLLDIMMGEMSGYKLLQTLREKPETKDIPVIFCTAKDTKDDTITGLNLGADDYISKPFLAREVVARVRSLLRRSYARH